jgi:superoxide dismutase, Fe-Mn family
VKPVVAPLPYPLDALEPTLSALALEVHYEKHHKGYAEKLAKLTQGTPQEKRGLQELIRTAEGAIFDNAAQVWNHGFFWQCMRPGGGGRPEGALLREIETSFGSFERLRDEFSEVASSLFGSGWVWIVRESDGRLSVQGSPDAHNPLRDRKLPLLTLDVWEHAYYLDYRNERARWIEGFLGHLVNWSFAASNLEAADSARSATGSDAEAQEARNPF